MEERKEYFKPKLELIELKYDVIMTSACDPDCSPHTDPCILD